MKRTQSTLRMDPFRVFPPRRCFPLVFQEKVHFNSCYKIQRLQYLVELTNEVVK